MKSVLSANQTALLGSVIMPRDFIEITVRDRSSGVTHAERLWSDVWDITADVRDPDSSGVLTYSWIGAYGLVSMDPIPRVALLEVQRINVTLLAHGTDIDRILRTYDPDKAPVRIWRGFMDTSTRRMVAAAEVRFIGNIDDIDLPRGTETSEVAATLTLVSKTQEATRFNPDTRSDASQQARSPGDTFYKDAATVGDWTIFWGQQKQKVV